MWRTCTGSYQEGWKEVWESFQHNFACKVIRLDGILLIIQDTWVCEEERLHNVDKKENSNENWKNLVKVCSNICHKSTITLALHVVWRKLLFRTEDQLKSVKTENLGNRWPGGIYKLYLIFKTITFVNSCFIPLFQRFLGTAGHDLVS